jgi:hypothetical protein
MRKKNKFALKLVGPLDEATRVTVNPYELKDRGIPGGLCLLRGWWAALLFLLLTLTLSSGAQEFRGTISGTVSDEKGALIPGASITVRETSTGTENHTVSDSAGQYVVPFLLPGTYTLDATAQGFAEFKRTGIQLDAQGHPIVNLTLQIGATTQSVVVTDQPPQLNVANGSIGQVISTESVADLPLNGRTPTTLAELSVGVITTAAPEQIHPFDNNAGNSWSMGGTPNQVSEVLLDGSPDLTLLGALAYAPSQDSVAEVSVRPFDTDASFGHTIGGVINQVTKGGTNRLHGTAYEFGQISGIDANTYFNNRNGGALPTFHFNQYGLTVGGPIWIPKVFNGQNRLFFFFAWEGLKDSTPTTTTTTVPTAAEESGDFSQLLTAACNGGKGGSYTINGSGVAICNDNNKPDPNQLYNPFTATTSGSNVVRQPIVGNQLTTAVSAFNPIALAYLKLFPAPNATVGVTPAGQDNYVSNAPSVDNYNNEFGRLDYNLKANDHMFFDFRHNYRLQLKNDYFGNGGTGTTLLRENLGSTFDNVLTISPTMFLDTRLNWVRFNEVHGTPGQKYSPTTLGYPSYMNSSSQLLQLPFINFSTGGSCGSFTSYQCLGDTGSALDPTTSYQFFTDVIKTIGNHTLKVGFDGRQYRMSIQNFGDSSGSFTFNSSFVTSGTTGAAQTFGGDLASFMLGLPSSGEFDLNARSDYHQYYFGTFVQDDWHVNSRLTLNLGLRFDIDTPFEEKAGRTVNGFNPAASVTYATTPTLSAPVTVSSNGQSYTVSSINTAGGLTFPSGKNGAVYATNNGFLSPRLGFSFALDPKTVLRGGFGIFVMPEGLSNLSAAGSYSSSAISNSEGFSAATTYLATTNNFQTAANTLSSPFPNGFAAPAGSSLGANTFLGQAISFLAPVQHDVYSERWNLDVQRLVSNSDTIEVLYVGNHGLHLPISSQNLNALPLQYLSTTPYRNQAMASSYGKSVTNPFYKTLGSSNTTSVNASKTVAFSNLLYPFPQFGSAAVTIQNQTIGQSFFESVMAHYEHRTSHGLTLTANYSFSKMLEEDTFLNDQDTMPTLRVSPFDHSHHFTAGGTYALPVGANQSFSLGGKRWFDELFGGYVVNAIYQFQTGAPLEFGTDIPLQPGYNIRQIYNKTRNTAPTSSGTPALNTTAFVTGNSTSCPSSGPCDGSAFINGQYTFHHRTLPQTMSWVRQDGYNNLDASVLKNFKIAEKSYFQLRFESFNTLNHAIFAAPNISSATAGNFGYITAVTSNSQPRQFQIGGRLVF